MVLYKINGENGIGPELKKKFGVIQYPTFLMMNADLELINRWAGYSGKAQFSQKLAHEMTDLVPIKEKRVRYQEKPTTYLALSLADYHESRLEFGNALTMVKDAIQMAPEKKPELLLQVLRLHNKMLMNGKEGASIEEMGKTLNAVLADPKIKADPRTNILLRGAWLFFDKGRPKQAWALLEILESMDKTSLSEDSQETYDTGLIYQAWAKDLERFSKAPAKVAASVLKSYAGDYGPSHLKLKNGQLRYNSDEVPATNLIPMSKNMFCVEGKPIFRLEVVVDKSGNPTKLIGHYPGGHTDEMRRDKAGAVN